MQKGSDQKPTTSESRWVRELDYVLSVGMKHGRRGVHEAIQRVLCLGVGLTRGEVLKRVRYLRRHLGRLESERTEDQKRREGTCWRRTVRKSNQRRPWTEQEDKDLGELAGYEAVKRLSERLNRSESAIRFRLSALGLRGGVRDAWSLRKLSTVLHVHRRTLLGWIATGQLRVTDSRITRKSLLRLLEAHRTSLSSTAEKRLFNSGAEAYTWKQVEHIFDVPEEEVSSWIARGMVRIVNPSVTERALEHFCERAPGGLNLRRIDAEDLEWLIEGYGLKVTIPSNIRKPVDEQQKKLPAS